MKRTAGIDLIELAALMNMSGGGSGTDSTAREMATTAMTEAQKTVEHSKLGDNAVEANNIKSGEVTYAKLNSDVTNVISGKMDKPDVVITDSASVTVTLPNNTDYICTTALTDLTVTLANGYTDGYASSIAFTSGSTATEFNCPTPLFTGTDCEDNEFIPETNTRYNITIWYDGAYVIGAVLGNKITEV